MSYTYPQSRTVIAPLDMSLRRYAAILLLCLCAGCAVGNQDEIPCTTDEECPQGDQCDLAQKLCVSATITTNVTPNATPNGTPNGSTNVDPNNVNGSTNIDPNNANVNSNNQTIPGNNTTGPNNVTNNNTSNNQTNNQTNNNTTVDPNVCNPACQAPATCVNNACVFPDCAAVGDACDPARPSQGGFTCVDVEGQGICVEPCERAFSVDGCTSGSYCLPFELTNVCVPSECASDSDCGAGGTCIEVENGFNTCLDGGNIPSGEACDPANDLCPTGEACDPLTGFCEFLCDPYAAAPCADAGHYCGVYLTAAVGLCSHALTSAAPAGPFTSCDVDQGVCHDASQCYEFDPSVPVRLCLTYCRPGMNDCAGVTAGSTATVCDPYFTNTPGRGVCWPPCSGDSCGDGYECVSDVCRKTCTAGNELMDCCNGVTPCFEICNANNHCE